MSNSSYRFRQCMRAGLASFASQQALGLMVVAALLVSREAGADPPKSKVIILSDADSWSGRHTSSLASDRRSLETERRGLTTCQELALSEDPTFAAEIRTSISIAPNGEVNSVTFLGGAIPEPVRACVRSRLNRLQFDPPGGQGTFLRVTIVFGEPTTATPARLPFRIEPDSVVLALGPMVMRFDAPPPAPAFRAVRAAVDVVNTCVKQAPPDVATTFVAQLLVTDSGMVARFDTSISSANTSPNSPVADAIARCIAEKSWPAATGRLSRIDLKVSITTKGKVTLAP